MVGPALLLLVVAIVHKSNFRAIRGFARIRVNKRSTKRLFKRLSNARLLSCAYSLRGYSM